MRLFRRSGERDADELARELERTRAFWAWWETARAGIARAIAEGTSDYVEELSDRVHSIHPNLAWELCAGSSAAHALVVSSDGIAELRSVAERVRRAAPAADETFEYWSARGPDPASFEFEMKLDDVDVPLAETRFAADVDDERGVIDVVVFNPVFGDLEEGGRKTVAYLTLDWILGEDDVERWIGTVDTATDLPPSTLSREELADLAHDLRTNAGEGEWVLLEGEDDGEPFVAVVRRPLRRVDWPLCDRRLDIAVSLVDESSVASAQALEDAIDSVLDGDGVYAATTTELERGVRTTHVYVDPTSDVAARVAEAVDRAELSGPVSVTVEPDPTWAKIRPYL
jgi:hypothetical protein